MIAMRAHRRRLPAAHAGDTDRTLAVARLQRTCPCWLVMWSAWRQTFTGFACFTGEPLIVDEARMDTFLARVRQVEQVSAGGSVVGTVSDQTPASSWPRGAG